MFTFKWDLLLVQLIVRNRYWNRDRANFFCVWFFILFFQLIFISSPTHYDMRSRQMHFIYSPSKYFIKKETEMEGGWDNFYESPSRLTFNLINFSERNRVSLRFWNRSIHIRLKKDLSFFLCFFHFLKRKKMYTFIFFLIVILFTYLIL